MPLPPPVQRGPWPIVATLGPAGRHIHNKDDAKEIARKIARICGRLFRQSHHVALALFWYPTGRWGIDGGYEVIHSYVQRVPPQDFRTAQVQAPVRHVLEELHRIETGTGSREKPLANCPEVGNRSL